MVPFSRTSIVALRPDNPELLNCTSTTAVESFNISRGAVTLMISASRVISSDPRPRYRKESCASAAVQRLAELLRRVVHAVADQNDAGQRQRAHFLLQQIRSEPPGAFAFH